MLTQEQMNEVEKVFIENQWVKKNSYPISVFKKVDTTDSITINFAFSSDEAYLEINDFGTYVPYVDMYNMTPEEVYYFLLTCLEDQFSDYITKYQVSLKEQHEFILTQIKENTHEHQRARNFKIV